MMRRIALVTLTLGALALPACGRLKYEPDPAFVDATVRPRRDAGQPTDAGGSDAGPRDAGPIDAAILDAGDDAGEDAGAFDAGDVDAARDDAGADAGFDAGPADAGTDAGPPDAGSDAGSATDAGPASSCPMPGARAPITPFTRSYGSSGVVLSGLAFDPAHAVYAAGTASGGLLDLGTGVLPPFPGSIAFVSSFGSDARVRWGEETMGATSTSMRAVAANATDAFFGGTVNGSFSWGAGMVTSPSGTSGMLLTVGSASGTEGRNAVASATTALVSAVSLGPDGAVLVGGEFRGTLQIGGMSIGASTGSTANGFIALFDATLSLQWARIITSSGRVHLWGVYRDGAPRAVRNFIYGDFQSDATFVGGPSTSAPGSTTGFVASYQDTGYEWHRTFPLSTSSSVRGLDVLVGTGKLVVAGETNGNGMIGPTMLSSTTDDGFVAQLDQTTGVVQWLHPLASGGADAIRGVGVLSGDSIYVLGQSGGDLTVQGRTVPNAGGSDVFVAGFDCNGTYVSSQTIASTVADQAVALAADRSGRTLAVAFTTLGTPSVPSGATSAVTSAGLCVYQP